MHNTELARQIFQIAHITGTFLLRSGQVSHEYFDKYLFEADPNLLRAIAEYLAPLIPAGTQVLAGLDLGGIPIATALSLHTGLPTAFVRKQAKTYGTCKLAEGTAVEGKQVCIIEDVITTGGQVLQSAEALRQLGACVDHVLCVILRNPEAEALLGGQGLGLSPAFTMEELWAAR